MLTLENHGIIEVVDELEALIQSGKSISQGLDLIKKLTTIAQHYGKKDELMFPLLKDQYAYPGPSDVMWGVEDEIRDRLKQILYSEEVDNQKEALEAVLKRIREMIYKEENILFPLCASLFSEEEWLAIAKDLPMFGACMIEEIPTWSKVKEDVNCWLCCNKSCNGCLIWDCFEFSCDCWCRIIYR